MISKSHWVWDPPQEEAFTKVKYILISDPVLTLFDHNLDTVVSSDASSVELGAAEAVKWNQKTSGICF